MIGRATAPVQPTARRLVQRVWGTTDIDDRQKWAAVWPAIDGLPRTALRLLDAGCGDGTWTIELARRRPPWRLIGIDRDPVSITRARSMAEQLSIQSASFITTDFLDYHPDARSTRCSASPPRTIWRTRDAATRCSSSSRAGSLPAVA